jgi:Core-2/I-Branching enzyme
MLAYFLAVHKNPEQVLYLLEAIYREEDIFAIHVDSKSPLRVHSDLQKNLGRRPNIRFLPSEACNWGSWSQVKIELSAIADLLNRPGSWRHFIDLSGQDYPLAPVDFIKQFLRGHPGDSFMEVTDPLRNTETDEYDLFVRRWDRYHWELKGRGTAGPYRLPLIPHRFPKNLKWFRGSNWKILSREFCEFVVAGTDDTVKASKRFWRWTACPDESFFQTLAMNSRFRDRVVFDNKREIAWPGPKTLTMADYAYLKKSRQFFARKFDMSLDRSVLDRLAADLRVKSLAQLQEQGI